MLVNVSIKVLEVHILFAMGCESEVDPLLEDDMQAQTGNCNVRRNDGRP
jgi:hypothetical protein